MQSNISKKRSTRSKKSTKTKKSSKRVHKHLRGGGPTYRGPTYNPENAQMVQASVNRFMADQEKVAQAVKDAKTPTLQKVANTLTEYGNLISDQIAQLMKSYEARKQELESNLEGMTTNSLP